MVQTLGIMVVLILHLLARVINTIYSLNPHNEYGSIDWNPDEFERALQDVSAVRFRENRDKICRTESFMMEDAEYAIVDLWQ